MSEKLPTPAEAGERQASAGGEEIAQEASRYLDIVETFAALDADPHADVRIRAAQKREAESRTARPRAAAERRPILRWKP